MANVLPTNFYQQQLVEIANSPYYESVALETLEDMNFKATLQRMGYTITADGTVVSPTVAAAVDGTAVTGNAVVSTTVTTTEAATTVEATALPATTTTAGTSIKSGATLGTADFFMFAAATAEGARIGYKSYKEYPEFWTELSNRLFDPNKADPGHQTATEFLVRVLEDGGVATYCDKVRLQKALTAMWEMGIFDANGSITPDHNYSGTYAINQDVHHTNGLDDAFMIIANNGRYIVSEQQRNYIVPRVQDPECDGLTVLMSPPTESGIIFRVCMWNKIDDPVTVVKNEEGRYIDIHPNTALKYVWSVYSNGLTSEFPEKVWYQDTLLNGTYDDYYTVIYSDVDSATKNPNPAINYDEGYTYPADLQALLDMLDDWAEDGFTINKLSDNGDVVPVTYVPLKLNDFNPEADDVPSQEKQDEAQSGKNPFPENNPLPDWFTNIFINTPITPPGIPQYPEKSDGDTPAIVTPSASMGNKLYTVYHPSNATLDALGGVLWDNSITEQIVKMFTNNPMDAIISLHEIYCTPTDGATKNIKLGSYNSNVPAPTVPNRYKTIDCGSVFIPEIYKDARDYTDTQCEIFLPFISYRSLDIRDVVNCNVNVVYTIDLYTGSCLASVNITKEGATQTLYTFEGNCGAQIPLTASQRNGLVSLISATASSLIGGVTGGVGGAVAMGVGRAVAGVGSGQFQANISRTSGFSGNAGAMSVKKPFIIITRNKSADAYNYEHYIGNPTNRTVYLSDCKGYTRVKAVHVENIPGATDKEKDMIKALLEGGVIL